MNERGGEEWGVPGNYVLGGHSIAEWRQENWWPVSVKGIGTPEKDHAGWN